MRGRSVAIEQMIGRRTWFESTERNELGVGFADMTGPIYPGGFIYDILIGTTGVEESSFARMLIEKGFKIGFEIGLHQASVKLNEDARKDGRRIEAIRILLRLIKRRFQDLDETLKSRIESLTDIEFLEQLYDQAIDAPSLDLLRSELQKHAA